MPGSYKDTLRFFFTVTDVEGDTVFVSFYYRSANTSYPDPGTNKPLSPENVTT